MVKTKAGNLLSINIMGVPVEIAGGWDWGYKQGGVCMLQWCMAHPWLTVIIAISIIMVLDHIRHDVATIIINKQRLKAGGKA